MPVQLQIVGVYYKQPLAITFTGQKQTPKDILDFAINNPIKDASGNPIIFLSYGFAQVGPNSESPVGNYVDFIAATYKQNTPPSVGGNSYVPETYGLAQTFTGQTSITYSVWQYYIRDQNGMPVTLLSPELPFNDEQTRVIDDNYTLIWRQVNICGGQQVPKASNLVAASSGSNLNARLAKLISDSIGKV